MALQNIGASNRNDAFYRYKMPKMVTKIEGRGNGIKTNVVNMVDIAKALARPASYTTKYFGNELGAQSKFDAKTGIALVNGSHDTAKLAALLENFIKRYVQCYGCGNPETEIQISKLQLIVLKCAACGFVSNVDMRDKLTTFILKNPPDPKKASCNKAMRRAERERAKEGEAVDEEQKKPKKETVKKKGVKDGSVHSRGAAKKKSTNGFDEDHSPQSLANGDLVVEEDVQWQTDTSLEAAQQRIQEQLTAVTADMVLLSTNSKKSKLTNEQEVLGRIKDCLSTNSPEKLSSVFQASVVSPAETMALLFQCFFSGGVGRGFNGLNVKEYLRVASGVVHSNVFLQGIESFFGNVGSRHGRELPIVLQVLYESDLLEEEEILGWYRNGISGGKEEAAVLWKLAQPFVQWLETAESESDEE